MPESGTTAALRLRRAVLAGVRQRGAVTAAVTPGERPGRIPRLRLRWRARESVTESLRAKLSALDTVLRLSVRWAAAVTGSPRAAAVLVRLRSLTAAAREKLGALLHGRTLLVRCVGIVYRSAVLLRAAVQSGMAWAVCVPANVPGQVLRLTLALRRGLSAARVAPLRMPGWRLVLTPAIGAGGSSAVCVPMRCAAANTIAGQTAAEAGLVTVTLARAEAVEAVGDDLAAKVFALPMRPLVWRGAEAVTAETAATLNNGIIASGTNALDHMDYILTADGTLYVSGDGPMYNYTANQYSVGTRPGWFAYRTRIKKVVIEGNITSVGQYAFCSNTNAYSPYNNYYRALAEVVITAPVTEICSNAFSYSEALKKVSLGTAVTHIYKSAFYRCTALTSVDLGPVLEDMGATAFSGCSALSTVRIPATVQTIGGSALDTGSTFGLIYCYSATPPALAGNKTNPPFNNIRYLYIYVPAASVEAYKAAANWSTYASKISALPE